jgi:predicted transcriptional regulator of viral defense system
MRCGGEKHIPADLILPPKLTSSIQTRTGKAQGIPVQRSGCAGHRRIHLFGDDCSEGSRGNRDSGVLCVTQNFDKIRGMGDVARTKPDHSCLFAVATGQRGYFTAAQARACGFAWDALTYHTRHGRFLRIRRALYRLRDYPSSPREDVVAAWLAVGKDVAVVSHESALDLLGLSDVIPGAIHLTVPRTRRHLPALPGVAIHTTARPLRADDVAIRDGIRLTAAARTILDAADAGTAPEQVALAVRQAIARGLTTAPRLVRDAGARSTRVTRLIADAVDAVAA